LGYKLDPHRSHNGMAVVTGNTVGVRLIELRGNHTLVAGGLASKPNAFGGLHYIDARTMPGQRLIAEMATKNRTWGEERIAAERVIAHAYPRRQSWPTYRLVDASRLLTSNRPR